MGIDQRLNERVSLDLTFRDDDGRDVRLGDCLGDRPAVLALVYFECPLLCTQVLNGLRRAFKPLGLRAGEDFHVVAVSIDPMETPELAARKKRAYLTPTDREEGWHFLTGREGEISRLARDVGFRFRYEPKTRQYAHAAGIMILTPDGRLSRYFYGIEYSARDLRLGLVEASKGRIGGLADRLLLLCYRYDPTTGKYGVAVMNLIRAGAILTVLALGAAIWIQLRRERKRRRPT
ncbi:MAG: SCO family protein [Planctomycetes bacterium]|nr:SCO family protein [Planctomycetota bacterium]